MKKRTIGFLAVCAAALAVFFLTAGTFWPESSVTQANADNFVALLTDLVKASETPSAGDAETIAADLEAIRAAEPRDLTVAKAIAEHWMAVYANPDYELLLYHGDDSAPELADAGIPNSRTHAFVVLGYVLSDGEMQPELVGRCDAAAAAAKRFPETILVCSGGATGENNPDQHTEAGLMKAYLTEKCGIDPKRIFIDDQAMTTAENAANTFSILRRNSVRSMTIVTSSYHQKRGQVLYNLYAELFRQRYGRTFEILGNYSFDVEYSQPIYKMDARIAVQQIADILGIPKEAARALPTLRGPAPAGQNTRPSDDVPAPEIAPRDPSEDLLLLVDFQNVYMPGNAWACPSMPEAMKNTIKVLSSPYAPDYLMTRFIAPAEPEGRWEQYNEAYREINEDPFLSEIPEALASFASDGKVVDKSTYSSLDAQPVISAMKGKKAVVLTGVVADCCVIATMYDAIDLGYEVVYLYDCIGGPSPEAEAEIRALAEVFSPIHTTVMSSDEYLASIAQAGALSPAA